MSITIPSNVLAKFRGIYDGETDESLNLDEWLAKFEQGEKFKRPETVHELLSDAFEWASDEQRWSCGNWIEGTDKLETDTRKTSTGRYTEGAQCTNVRACAMSILLLCAYNGPLVRAYYADNDAVEFMELCQEDPLVRVAAVVLAKALDDLYSPAVRQIPWDEVTVEDIVTAGPRDAVSMYVADAINSVIARNDEKEAIGISLADGEHLDRQAEHHRRIMVAFERARDESAGLPERIAKGFAPPPYVPAS